MEWIQWEPLQESFCFEKMRDGPIVFGGTILNLNPENIIGDVMFARSTMSSSASARLPVVTRLGQTHGETQHNTLEITNGAFCVPVIRKDAMPFLIHMSGVHFFDENPVPEHDASDSAILIVPLDPLEASSSRPIVARRVGNIIFLTGEIPTVTFHGFVKVPVALLPEGFCPPRTIQSVCAFQWDVRAPVTILPNGYIEVGPVATEGSKVRSGNISFDSVCFPLVDGADITPPMSIMLDFFECDPTLYAFRYDCVVMLSGRVTQRTILPPRFCPRVAEHVVVSRRFGGLADVLTIGVDGHISVQSKDDDSVPVSVVYLSIPEQDLSAEDLCADLTLPAAQAHVAPDDETQEAKWALDGLLNAPYVNWCVDPWAYPNTNKMLDMKRRQQQWLIDVSKRRLKDCDKETFENIRAFMLRHDTLGMHITHCNLNGSFDLFTNTGKWNFPSDSTTRDSLYGIIEWCWYRDMALFMTEKQGSIFPFIEDVDIQATSDWNGPNSSPPDVFIVDPPWVSQDPGWFIRERAETLFSIFTEFDELTCYVYTASGKNRAKGILKSSFHLIWPNIYVHAVSAPKVRQQTLHDIETKLLDPSSFWRRLEDVLLQLHPSNSFDLIFDKTTVLSKSGLRLPFCDKAVMTPDPEVDDMVKAKLMDKNDQRYVRIPENRPNYPIGELKVRYDREKKKVADAWWVRTASEVPISEWVRRGACGLPEGREARLSRCEFRPSPEGWC